LITHDIRLNLKHDSEQLDDDQHNYILSCGLLEHFTPLWPGANNVNDAIEVFQRNTNWMILAPQVH